jgi:hypothetical protein
MQRYIGPLLIENIKEVRPETVFDYRLPKIEENFEELARQVQNQEGAYGAIQVSRLEYQFPGWSLQSCVSQAQEFCGEHGVTGLLDLEPTSNQNQGGGGTEDSNQKEDQVLRLLQSYGVDICAIPLDQVMSGLLDSLEGFRHMVSKFCSLYRNNKCNWEYQDRQEFSIAWVQYLAEFGIRKSAYRQYEESIFTDPASHPNLTHDLIENALWVSREKNSGEVQYCILDRVKSRDEVVIAQRIGISTKGNSGVCPKCGVAFHELVTYVEPISQTKFHIESQHIAECEGTKMDSLHLQPAVFTVQDGETLADIADILEENVYVLLTLNIENENLRQDAPRKIGTVYEAREKMLLTVNTKMKGGHEIVVPDRGEVVSGMEDRKCPGRDNSGRFQTQSETSQRPQRHRPEKPSGVVRRRRPAEQFLKSFDPDFLAPENARPSRNRKKWFPDLQRATCYYIYLARKAWFKCNNVCSVEEAWHWRYLIAQLIQLATLLSLWS